LGHKFFIWLLIRNQLNTRNLLKWRTNTWMTSPMSYVTLVQRKLVFTYFLNVNSTVTVGTLCLSTGIWISNLLIWLFKQGMTLTTKFLEGSSLQLVGPSRLLETG
jgi:hypothetical protein